MDEEVPATFGAVLKRYRLRAGWTQEALAERAGISARGVSDLERGLYRAPQRDTLGRLVGALGLDADERRGLESVAQPVPRRPPPGAPPRAARAAGGRGHSRGHSRGHNLPAPLTSFVGRAAELAEVERLLGAAALVTITGAGGTGKTRLALEVAARALPGYADGVWLVELAPLADPALVPQAVAGVLGIREQPGRPLATTLAEALTSRRLLLVLDNCEHLVETCAELIGTVLRACPGVGVLATSRDVLRVPGETVWRTPPLELPPPGETSAAALAMTESVRLFVERARSARPGFTLRAENAGAVAELCRRLDGLPLALELAAARARVLPVGDLLERLQDRFRLLTGGSRTMLPRQQSLAATVAWSYDLLSEPDRALFARLAVFAGGWSLEAAERVVSDLTDDGEGPDGPVRVPVDDVLERLTRLVDRSLVIAEDDSEGHARFRMLETLREYAAARLLERGEAEVYQERHLVHFVALAEAGEAAFQGPDQRTWLDRLEREHHNCRAALHHAIAHPAPGTMDRGLRLAGALPWFWIARGDLREAHRWLDALLSGPGLALATVARVKALAQASVIAWFLGDAAEARRWREAALAGAQGLGDRLDAAAALEWLGFAILKQGDVDAALPVLREAHARYRRTDVRTGEAWTLRLLAEAAREQGDYGTARRFLEESVALYGAEGNPLQAAGALHALGRALRAAGDVEASRRLHEEALSVWRRLGYQNGVAGALNALGEIAAVTGDPETARSLFEESLLGYRAVGFRHDTSHVLVNLALLARAAGDFPTAHHQLEEALTTWRTTGDEHRVAQTWETLAGLLAAEGQPQRAFRVAGAAVRLHDVAGRPVAARQAAALGEQLAPARSALGDAAAEVALLEGRNLPFQQVIAEAVYIDRSAASGVGADLPRGPVSSAAPPSADASSPPALTPKARPDAGTRVRPSGPLRVDPETYTVWRGAQPLPRPLAAKEFALIRYLYAHAGRVCSRQELGDAVWGGDRWDPDMLYRLVRRVKEKLEPHPARPRYLQNVPGFGYRLSP